MTTIKMKAKKGASKKNAKSPVKKALVTSTKKLKNGTVQKARKKVSPVKKVNTVASKKTTVKKIRTVAIKKVTVSVKSKNENAVNGITVPEILKQAEELHMIPVQSDVHPITIEENKKLEPQFHIRVDAVMLQENSKVKNALATRNGARTIYRTRRRS